MSTGSAGLSPQAKKLLKDAVGPKKLAELLRQELENGCELVPLLGGGMSLPAGIPTIPEVTSYLERCICMALGLYKSSVRPWNPRTDQWPAMQKPDEDEGGPLGLTIGQLFEGKESETNVRRTRLEALGALAEWRSALRFLGRIKERSEDGPSRVPALGPYVPSVTDSFFQHVTAGRIPTLAHRLLASLSDTLRNHIVLTTNFDNLYETAARDLQRPVTVYDVHINARLPLRRLVDKDPSLIKLHGGSYGLRADESLDDRPLDEESKTFVSYFTREPSSHPASERAEAKRHLLVMGYGAKDERINKLIKDVLDKVAIKIFWICYCKADVEKLADEFTAEELERFTIVVHKATGLLLAELHQRLTFALPSARVRFPSVSEVSFPPSHRNRYGEALKKLIDGEFKHGADAEERRWAMLSHPLYHDAIRLLSQPRQQFGQLIVMTNARENDGKVAPYFGISVMGRSCSTISRSSMKTVVAHGAEKDASGGRQPRSAQIERSGEKEVETNRGRRQHRSRDRRVLARRGRHLSGSS